MRNRLLSCLITILFTVLIYCAQAQNCTLPVDGGTLSAPQTTVCSNTSFTINVIGGSTGAGLSYNWERSPDNINWTPLSNIGNSLFYTQSEGSWYRRVTTCSAGGFAYSNSIFISLSNFLNCYCTPSSSSCSSYSITNVNFGSINNPSACGVNAYTNYSTTVSAADIMQGAFLPISVTVTNGSNARFVHFYIDYNQNGSFDPKEYTMLYQPSGNVYSGFIKVPFTAKTGVTRMRIMYNSGTNNTCFQDPLSETEDYAINITPNTTAATGHVIYVKINATNTDNSGRNWANAKWDLRSALAIATPGDTIKVAAGTYYAGTSQSNGTRLQDSIFIMGGYPATGSPTNADRNAGINQTILSGAVSSTNSNADYHVLYASGNRACMVDGFIIQNGGGNFGSGNQAFGGGIYLENSTDIFFRNCVFRNNISYSGGAAISVYQSSAAFSNCIITRHNDYYSNILVQRNSQVNFTNLLAAKNTGNYLLWSDSSSITFSNSTIAKNETNAGLVMAATQSQVNFINSIAYYNSVYNASWQTTNFDSAEVTLDHSTAVFQSSLMQVANNGSNLILGVSPKFKDTSNVAGADGFYFSNDDGYSLMNPCSPAMNAGSNALASGISTDITGLPRIFGTAVDLGAYEVQQSPSAIPKVIYVNPLATGANDGSSWANAYKDLHQALQMCCDTIKLAAGTYQPWKSQINPSYYWIENKRVILGAFPATGNPTNADRNYDNNPTRFDGLMNSGEKATLVCLGLNLDSTSIIDGITFTNTGRDISTSDGALVYANCNNPVIRNCDFTGNRRRAFSGRNNKNPVFLNCRTYNNNSQGSSYGLDLFVMTNGLKTTFRNCVFNNNYITTSTSITYEFGRVLSAEGNDAIIDSCLFLRNQGTVMVNFYNHSIVTNSAFLRNMGGENTRDLYNASASPVFRNCIFYDSTGSANEGGIMHNYFSNPGFTNCQFYNGLASFGGVAFNDSSSAHFTNCVFTNSVNTFYNKNGSNMTLDNCVSTGHNFTFNTPGFMYNFRSSPVITNTVVVNGKSGGNGLMFNDGGSNPQIRNSVFWKNFLNFYNNVDLTNAIEIRNQGNSVPVIQNSMFEIYNAGPGSNTTNVDPRFKNYLSPVGKDSIWFTADDGLRLCDCSPAINSGNTALTMQTTDVTGATRVAGGAVDRGAYELQSTPGSWSHTSYVNASALGSNDGSSWDNAYTSFQSAVLNTCADTIKVAAGIYKASSQYRDSGYLFNRNLWILGSYDVSTGVQEVDVHPSILSGDVGIQNDSTDNSNGLVNAVYMDTLVIDGMVLQGASRNINAPNQFSNALNAQGIQYILVNNSRFYNNYSNTFGGAFNFTNVKKTEIRRTVFRGNRAVSGAGLYFNYTGPVLVADCVFDRNQADYHGGGIWTGQAGSSFVNCLFTGNKALGGAGMALDNNPDVLVTNCTFANNIILSPGGYGGGITSVGATWQGGGAGPYIGNCIFTGNTTEVYAGTENQSVYHDIYYNKYGYPPSGDRLDLRIHHSAVTTPPEYFWGGGLISPGSIVYKNKSNPVGPDGKWFTDDDGLQLAVCSDGIDDGANSSVTAAKDLAGRPRIFNTTVDLGSYEFNGQPLWSKILDHANDSLIANKEITDSLGWTHYYRDCQYLMSIKKSGQNIGSVGDGTFALKVFTGAGYHSGTAMNLTGAAYNTSGMPWYVMNRYWNVSATNPVQDSILVRFPYTNADFNDVTGSNTSVSQHTQMEFFKVNGTQDPFDLNVTAANFTRYTHAGAPNTTHWTYAKQDSIHTADYFVKSFSGGGGGAHYNASLPDLHITMQGITPSSIGSGGNVTVSYTEENLNGYAAGAHKVHFYVSTDNILSSADLLLGSQDIASLNSLSNTGSLAKQLQIPCSVAAGTYFLIVVADGQQNVDETNEYNNSASINITVTPGQSIPVTPVITANPSGVLCGSGVVSLSANAASCTTCIYTWNNGSNGNAITVSSAGTYVVTVTNVCGTASAAYTVVSRPIPNVNYTTSATSVCSGNPVILSASGADSYVWSGAGLNSTTGTSVTATPAIAGIFTYQVAGTTNGCSDTLVFVIQVNPTPVLSISPDDTTICSGSSVTLTATGATTYSWSPSTGLNNTTGSSVISTPAGNITYTATGSANGCSSTKTRTILVSNAVTPSVSIAFTGCPGNTLTFTPTAVNGGSNPQFSWYVNNVLKSTGNTFILNNATNGTQVYARLISNAPCASTTTANSATTTVNCIVTAVSDIDGLESFSVSPNPSDGRIEIHMKLLRMKKVSFSVADGHGKVIKVINQDNVSGNHHTSIDLSSFAQGIYYLRTTIGHESFVEKVVIVR